MAGTVLYEADDRVATLTLNRPERLNTITPELIGDLREQLARAQQDDAIHAIRLRGAGRVFCAGYDISLGSAGDGGDRGRTGRGTRSRISA